MQENKIKKRNMSKILKLVSAIVVFLFFIAEGYILVEFDPYNFKLYPSPMKCTSPKDCEVTFIPPNMNLAVCRNGECLF
jgi:hypothetical protein